MADDVQSHPLPVRKARKRALSVLESDDDDRDVQQPDDRQLGAMQVSNANAHSGRTRNGCAVCDAVNRSQAAEATDCQGSLQPLGEVTGSDGDLQESSACLSPKNLFVLQVAGEDSHVMLDSSDQTPEARLLVPDSQTEETQPGGCPTQLPLLPFASQQATTFSQVVPTTLPNGSFKYQVCCRLPGLDGLVGSFETHAAAENWMRALLAQYAQPSSRYSAAKHARCKMVCPCVNIETVP